MPRTLTSKATAALRLALAAALCASLATPSFADKGNRAPVAAPVPELRIPPPAPLPPPVQIIEAPRGPMEISLPADFGTGGVGIDINGGYGGGGGIIVYGGAQARAQASATAVSFAFASASSFAGSRGGFKKGGKGGCGGCR